MSGGSSVEAEAGILGGFKSLELGFLLRLIGGLFDISRSTRGSIHTVEPLVSGHPWDRLEVSAYEGCPLTGG